MADENHIKACRDCGVSKPLSEFSKKERGILGVRAECNLCRASLRRKRYATDDAYRLNALDGQKKRCAPPPDGYMKRCPKCEETKPFEGFYRSKSSKDNCSSYCKACRNVMSTSYARDNKDKIRPKLYGYSLRRRYGITGADYEALLIQQDNKCAICGTTECPTGRNFAVDHCHSTGKVRGLLCGHCNQGLGVFRDDIRRLLNAIEYLKSHSKEHVAPPDGMR